MLRTIPFNCVRLVLYVVKKIIVSNKKPCCKAVANNLP